MYTHTCILPPLQNTNTGVPCIWRALPAVRTRLHLPEHLPPALQDKLQKAAVRAQKKARAEVWWVCVGGVVGGTVYCHTSVYALCGFQMHKQSLLHDTHIHILHALPSTTSHPPVHTHTRNAKLLRLPPRPHPPPLLAPPPPSPQPPTHTTMTNHPLSQTQQQLQSYSSNI